MSAAAVHLSTRQRVAACGYPGRSLTEALDRMTCRRCAHRLARDDEIESDEAAERAYLSGVLDRIEAVGLGP